ncbi:MAG TPA: helix-turn-helix transcriptional regulator [Myxococcaceae bacterium]|jgi:transcriptional regulator with XRE-family HTH domain
MPRAPANTPAVARSRRSTERNRTPPPLPRHILIRQHRLPATLSAALKQARKRAGMTQSEAAEGIGIAPEVYGRMERGGMLPSVPTLLRLCLILGSGPHELMGFAEMEPEQRAPGTNTVPPGLNDTPEKRRLLRRLARLDSPRIKALARLVALLLPRH